MPRERRVAGTGESKQHLQARSPELESSGTHITMLAMPSAGRGTEEEENRLCMLVGLWVWWQDIEGVSW